MQAIGGSVGEGGTNNAIDIALVEAILVKTLKPNSRSPYLPAYDHKISKATKDAIRAFQKDHLFVTVDGKKVPNPMVTPGLVAPYDVTWWALIGKVQPAFVDMRLLPTSRIVYVANPASDLKLKYDEIDLGGFTSTFRDKLVSCVAVMHARHGIAIGLASMKSSGRRNFQKQYELMTDGRGTTQAGPGESNHNWGMAADLGFQSLRWLQRDGSVVENETAWFHRMIALTGNQKAASKFYATMRAIGIEVGLFRGPENDSPHLQNWDDTGVSAARSLADQLTRSGTMRWSTDPKRYSCDLGLGGDLVHVGTSVEIWKGSATVSASEITKLRRAQAARAAKAQEATTGTPQKPQPVAAATTADVVAMRKELRRQFELAEANWQNWRPIQR